MSEKVWTHNAELYQENHGENYRKRTIRLSCKTNVLFILEHESAHTYVQQYSKTNHCCDHRSSPIGKEWQWNTDNWEKPNHHTNINNDMANQHG